MLRNAKVLCESYFEIVTKLPKGANTTVADIYCSVCSSVSSFYISGTDRNFHTVWITKNVEVFTKTKATLGLHLQVAPNHAHNNTNTSIDIFRDNFMTRYQLNWLEWLIGPVHVYIALHCISRDNPWALGNYLRVQYSYGFVTCSDTTLVRALAKLLSKYALLF